MRAICQRVKSALLCVGDKKISEIEKGFLVYIGFSKQDNEQNIIKALNKVCGLRVFDDADGKLNLPLKDVGGEILLVSNFTLYADCSRGFRPSFIESAGFEQANDLYNYSLEFIKSNGIDVKPCVFGGDMVIDSVADGPINIIIDSEDL